MSNESYLQTKEELQEYREEVDFDLQKFMRGDRPPNYNNEAHKCLTYLDVIHSSTDLNYGALKYACMTIHPMQQPLVKA